MLATLQLIHLGAIVSVSIIAIPGIAHTSPSQEASSLSHSLVQWRAMYFAGQRTMPFLAVLPTVAYAYLSFEAEVPKLRNLYAAASLLTFGIIPFTFTVMRPIVKTLKKKAAKVDKGEDVTSNKASREQEVLSEFALWSELNVVRGLLPFIGTILGVLAVFFYESMKYTML